nr:hypothetical protein [Streptomyces tsukubensis]
MVASPPLSSVARRTTRETSARSRSGSSGPWPVFRRCATPPLPDWLLTRITASYALPTSAGSTGGHGTSQGASDAGSPASAAVGVARVHRQPVAVLDGGADRVDVGEVDHRVDAHGDAAHEELVRAVGEGPRDGGAGGPKGAGADAEPPVGERMTHSDG